MFYFSEVTMLKVALIASNSLQGNEAVRRVDAIVTELSKQLQLSNGIWLRRACNFCQLASRNIPPAPLASVLLPTPLPSTWLNDQPSVIMIGCKQNHLRGWFNMMTKIDWNSNPSRNISPCRLTKGGGIQLWKSMCVSSCKYAHNHIFGKKRRRKSVEELRKTPRRKMGSKIYRGGSEEWETKQYCEALPRWRACLEPELPDVTDLRFWSSTKS